MKSVEQRYVWDAGDMEQVSAPQAIALDYNQSHDDRGRFAETDGSAGRSERARAGYKPSTAKKQRLGEAEQARLATAIGGKNTADNEPFDVIAGKQAIEVKTVMDNDNDKITVHPASRERKLAAARDGGLRPHTVAIDVRSGRRQYYYRAGVGAFRLNAMQRVSLPELRGMLR